MSIDRKASELTEQELAELLASKRAERLRGMSDYAAEEAGEEISRQDRCRVTQLRYDEASAAQTFQAKPCPQCKQLVRVARKNVARRVQSVGGEAILRRHYHRCARCKIGFYPLDAELELPDEGDCSARMTKLILDFGLHETFESGAERFAMHHGIAISENLVRRVVERIGNKATRDKMLTHRLREPATAAPTKLIVSADGSMLPTRGEDSWRETKLGIVARDEHCSASKGRGHISEARFVARMTGVEAFRRDLTRILSLERAWECPQVAFLGDGAPWIWNMAQEICPNAVQILDFMHAVGAAAKPAEMMFADDKIMMSVWTDTVSAWLRAGRVVELGAQLQECAFATRGKLREAFVAAARYFDNNASRMKYDEYRARGLPIGSGVIESAHRHVLQARMKRAGQHWDPIRADRLEHRMV
jgi:hypothetical protein